MSEYDAAERAVQAALDAGAVYADARVMHRRSESMTARNGDVDSVSQDSDSGLGVRALVGSGWGFFAVPDLTDRAVRDAGARAAEIARASALVSRDGAGMVPDERAGHRDVGERLRDRPVRGLAVRQGRPARRRHHDHARAGRRPRRGALPRLGHPQVVRLQRGPPHRPARARERRRHQRHRRSASTRPSAAPTPPRVASTAPVGGSWSRASTSRATPPGSAPSRVSCSPRPSARAGRPT